MESTSNLAVALAPAMIMILLPLIGNSHSLSCFTCTKGQHCKVEKCLGYLTTLGLGSHPTCLTVLKERSTFMRLCIIGDKWDTLANGSCAQAPLSKVAEVFKEFDTAYQAALGGGKINQTEVDALKAQGLETMKADVEAQAQSADEVRVCACTHLTCTTHNRRNGSGSGDWGDYDNPGSHNHHPHPPHEEPLHEKKYEDEEDDDGAMTLVGPKMVILLALVIWLVFGSRLGDWSH